MLAGERCDALARRIPTQLRCLTIDFAYRNDRTDAAFIVNRLHRSPARFQRRFRKRQTRTGLKRGLIVHGYSDGDRWNFLEYPIRRKTMRSTKPRTYLRKPGSIQN